MPTAKHPDLLTTLQARFEKNMQRHRGITWDAVEKRLKGKTAKLKALQAMEESGGEPDVIGNDGKDGFIFADCATESPSGRRSLCYDQEGLESRKEHLPAGNAVDEAAAMGIELLDEAGYHALQELGEFDLKTSSWLATPAELRAKGGALFGDRRYDRVFIYHNGAQSYYGARVSGDAEGLTGITLRRARSREDLPAGWVPVAPESPLWPPPTHREPTRTDPLQRVSV